MILDVGKGIVDMTRRIRSLQEVSKREKDVIRFNCVTDKLVAAEVNKTLYEGAAAAHSENRASADDKGAAHELKRIFGINQKVVVLTAEAENCIGEDLSFVGATRVDVEVDPNSDSSFSSGPAGRPTLDYASVGHNVSGYMTSCRKEVVASVGSSPGLVILWTRPARSERNGCLQYYFIRVVATPAGQNLYPTDLQASVKIVRYPDEKTQLAQKCSVSDDENPPAFQGDLQNSLQHLVSSYRKAFADTSWSTRLGAWMTAAPPPLWAPDGDSLNCSAK